MDKAQPNIYWPTVFRAGSILGLNGRTKTVQFFLKSLPALALQPPSIGVRCGGTVAGREKSAGLISGKPRAAIRRCCSGSVYGGDEVVSVPAYGSQIRLVFVVVLHAMKQQIDILHRGYGTSLLRFCGVVFSYVSFFSKFYMQKIIF